MIPAQPPHFKYQKLLANQQFLLDHHTASLQVCLMDRDRRKKAEAKKNEPVLV